MMQRRDFLKTVKLGGLGLYIAPGLAFCSVNDNRDFKGSEMIPLEVLGSSAPVSKEKRFAFGWSHYVMNPEDTVLLKPAKIPDGAYLSLRLTVALEMWEEARLQVYIPGKEESYLGFLDIRYSSVLVPYELNIDSKHIHLINKYGLKVKLEDAKAFGFFDQVSSMVPNQVFAPHILVSSNQKGEIQDFLKCFMSIQAFGWREGTVLDGLWQLYSKKGEERALKAINEHFALFFDDEKNLKYENSHNTPRDNRIDGIESTIPYATLSRINPNHPILNTVIEAWEKYSQDNGMVTDGPTLTAEGCYTVAYPMAVIGNAWDDADLKQNALDQLKHRTVLIEGGNLNLRYDTGKNIYYYKNWARGAAWTLLGFARTIAELKDDILDEEIIQKFKEGVDSAIAMQNKTGLWNGFMHTNNAPDCSGSAGISAAIMIGIKEGLLSESYRQYAEKSWSALQDYITPDGFLKGVSQDNRGGMKLQQGDYRVIAQMGMGLMAQLYAEIS